MYLSEHAHTQTHTHHFPEREGFISNCESIFAAQIPEYGIGNHQLQSGGVDPDNKLRQNHRRHIYGTIQRETVSD